MIAVLRGVMLVAVSTMLTPARGALGPQQRRGLSCGPHILRPTNTLRLRTPTPHGHYLVVVAPDKTQFFLVYPQEEDRKPSVIPPDRFAALSSVAFAVDSLRGWPQAALTRHLRARISEGRCLRDLRSGRLGNGRGNRCPPLSGPLSAVSGRLTSACSGRALAARWLGGWRGKLR